MPFSPEDGFLARRPRAPPSARILSLALCSIIIPNGINSNTDRDPPEDRADGS